jgi:hypothetical protein
MEFFVFLDLDDTIFQTKRKCPENTPISPAAFAKDGSVMSFFTPKQARLFSVLSHKTRLIPTTARDYDAFLRATIKNYEYAIINHGGIILRADGSVHQGWYQILKQKLSPVMPALIQLKHKLEQVAAEQGIDFNIRIIDDFGLSFYVLIKHQEKDNSALKSLLTTIIEPYLVHHALDFYCHLNDNNLAILPLNSYNNF